MPVNAAQQEKQTEPGDTFNLHRPMNKHVSRTFGLLMGMGVVVLFLGFVSLAPQIGQRLGKLSDTKQTQQSMAAVLTPPCTSTSGGYGDADGDGDVDTIDQVHISRFASGQSSTIPLTADVIKRSDVNGNLQVDTVDLLKVSRYVGLLDLTFPMCIDQDEDGYVNGVENYLGTNPYKACATSSSDVDSTKPGKPSKVWPADLSTSAGVPDTFNKITLQDITSFQAPIRRINTSPADVGYDRRWDLVPGKGSFSKEINIQDLTNLIAVAPPMFGGTTRAFNGPACVSKPAPTVNLTASSNSVITGGSITLSWISTNAVWPCSASGSWDGHKQLSSGSSPQTMSYSTSAAGTYTYTMTCYGSGGEISDTETVTVTAPSACPGVIVPRNLYRNSAGTIFVITDDCQKRGIVSPEAFNSCLYDWNAVIQATDADLNSVTNGSNTGGSPDCPPAPTVTIPPPVVNEPRGWPAIGKVGDLGVHKPSYGSYTTWEAVDILPYFGDTKVYATMDGTIKKYSSSSCSGEAAVDVENSSGYKVHYCHLVNITVSNGNTVTKGQLLGDMSNTGVTEGSGAVQVHYAISPNVSLNPPYVPFRPGGGNIINNLNDGDPSAN